MTRSIAKPFRLPLIGNDPYHSRSAAIQTCRPPPTSARDGPAAETREHVLAVAHELFYWHGIRATGVDAIAAEAEVAPTTLYRLFASKDDLIAAYIDAPTASTGSG